MTQFNHPRFAPVAPPELLAMMRVTGDFLIGKYHLVLAHDIVERPELYKNLFPLGSFVILDNSMVELGHPVANEVVTEAANIIQPSCVVMPDVRGKREKTVGLSRAARDEWGPLLKGIPLMAVPQGADVPDLIQCAKQLKEFYPQYWGVARTVTEDCGTRKGFTKDLQTLIGYGHVDTIHLLGFSDDLVDDLQCTALQGVMGIDSAVPVRMGQRKQMMHPTQEDPGPRGDFWTNYGNSIEPELIANLTLMREWLRKPSTYI